MSVGRLRSLLTSRPDLVSDQAAALLGTRDAEDELELHEAETALMRTVYERRARRDDPVVGVAELARRLASYDQAELKTVSTEVQGQIVLVWLDLGEAEVLGCVVGHDRRKVRPDLER